MNITQFALETWLSTISFDVDHFYHLLIHLLALEHWKNFNPISWSRRGRRRGIDTYFH